MWVITIILIWNISNIYSWKSKICFLNLTCYWMCFALTRLALYACLCTQIRIINMGVWQFAFRVVSTPCDLRITGSCLNSKLLIQAFINLGFEINQSCIVWRYPKVFENARGFPQATATNTLWMIQLAYDIYVCYFANPYNRPLSLICNFIWTQSIRHPKTTFLDFIYEIFSCILYLKSLYLSIGLFSGWGGGQLLFL